MSKKKSQPVFTQCHGHLLELKQGKPVKCPTCSRKLEITAQGYIKSENAPRSFKKNSSPRYRSGNVTLVEFSWFISIVMAVWVANMITSERIDAAGVTLAVMVWVFTYFITSKPKEKRRK